MNRKLAGLVTAVGLFGLNGLALAHGGNLYLTTTLKAVDKDIAIVLEPTKNPNPAQVSETAIVTAVVRARSAAYQLQVVLDRAGKFENGAIVKNEMTPSLDDETPAVQEEIMDKFAKALPNAKAKLVQAEQQLKAEAAKKPSARDFRALKATLDDLDKALTEINSLITT